MQLARICPFPVDVVPWSAPEPRLTVIVKATYALDRDGELHLAGEQRPLDGDQPEGSADDLVTASDRAPHKERVDVLLAGHAHAAAPTTAIEVSLTVGALRRRFHAVSTAPASAFPLTPAYLRTDPTPAGVAVRVGPLGPRSPARRAFLGDHAQDRAGAPLGSLAGDFDFGFFNAAPLPQQLEALPPGTEITLAGLLAGAPRRVVSIPRRRPAVYLVDAAERAGLPLGMRCDTLSIDVDRAQLCLVWRGSFDAAVSADRPVVLVGYEIAGTRYAATELHERLRAARREAVGPPAEAPPAGGRPGRAKTIVLEGPSRPYDGRSTVIADEGPPRPAALPFAPVGALRAVPPSKPHYDGRSTLAVEEGTRSVVLPFPESAPKKPAYDGRSTLIGEEGAPRGALPFAAAAPRLPPSTPSVTDTALPFRRSTPPPAPPPPRRDEETTLVGVEAPTAALPFAAELPPPPPPIFVRPDSPRLDVPPPPPLVPAPPPALAEEEDEEPPTIPPPPPEPEPERVTSDDDEENETRAEGRPAPPPEPLLEVAAFAAVRAELETGKRREVLARHGLDPRSWRRQERLQVEAIEQEARAGKADRAAALEEALRAAGAS